MTQPRIDSAAIDAVLAPFDRSDAPGFAVGVALGGRPGYRRGVGLASVELPVVLSPSIRMRIGSTSKHFTVLAVMLLAEEGRLSIEDSPRRHLPDLPGWADAMTVKQLMAHTSGMRDSLDLILHSAGPGVGAAPDHQFKAIAALDSVNFPPGEGWNYNNGGYVLLATLVERLSGRTFADFLRERIFGPVGMNDTLLRALDTDLVPNSATLHLASPTGGWTRGVFGVPIGGEGGIVSTIDDMLRWLAHMSTPVVGTTATWATMRTPVATHGYGLGLTIGTHRGLSTVHHAGAVMGGSCQMLKVVDHDLDVIVMTNGLGSLKVMELVDAIIDSCIPGLPPTPEESAGRTVAGIFYSAATGRRIGLEEADGAQAIRIDGMTLPARRDAEGALSVPLVPTDMRLTPAADGLSLTLDEYGRSDMLHLIEPPVDTSIEALAGEYGSAAAGLRASIAADEDGAARLILEGSLGSTSYQLTSIGPDLWEGRATGALPLALLIEVDEEGFRLTSGRTQRLRFARTA